MFREKKGFSRRDVIGGLATGAGMIAMPAVLRAQTMNWIGASAVPASDFIAQAADFFAKRVGELSKGQIQLTNHHAASLGGEREPFLPTARTAAVSA